MCLITETKAHLKRKSWPLWRQPKNSHVSPNVAKGFWRRCSSLKKSTQTHENGQSIWADSWTRWRRMSPPLQQRLKKNSGIIKHCVQWQHTKATAWKQPLMLQQRSICSINKFIQTEGQQVFIENEAIENVLGVQCTSLFFWFGSSAELPESFARAASAAGSVDIGIWSKHLLQRWRSSPW